MECIIGRIKLSVSSVLPHLSEETVNSVSRRLADEIGVNTVSDFCLVTNEDLVDLKPIDRRKLLRAWKPSEGQNVLPTVSESHSDTSLSLQVEMEVENPTESWGTFCIPWQQMPVKLMNALKAGERPTPTLKKKLTQITADSMHKITRRPGRKAIGIVSTKIVEQYPLLKDTLCGETFGNGYYSIFKSLENRIDYLNRGLGKKTCKKAAEVEVSAENNTKKVSKYGCINWMPLDLPENETSSSQIQKKEEMVYMLALGPDYDEEKLTALISDTFYSQRSDINNGLSIEEMHKTWPAIFTAFGFQKHFELLVGIPLKGKFLKKLECKGEVLIKTIKSVLKTSNKDQQAVMCEIKKFEEMMPIPSASVMIALLMAYFKEDKNSIFRLTNISTTRAEALKMDLPATPCLIVCGLELLNAELFMLCIDGYIVNDSITNFTDALLMLFASFFTFNICYPASTSSTLEFIQRCFANINPSRGSKKNQSKGKKAFIDPKVLTLLNLVADQEWLNC